MRDYFINSVFLYVELISFKYCTIGRPAFSRAACRRERFINNAHKVCHDYSTSETFGIELGKERHVPKASPTGLGAVCLFSGSTSSKETASIGIYKFLLLALVLLNTDKTAWSARMIFPTKISECSASKNYHRTKLNHTRHFTTTKKKEFSGVHLNAGKSMKN